MLLALSVCVALDPSLDSWNGLKSAVAPCGDVNGDGIPDLLLASRDYPNPECAWILSGKDGSVIRLLKGRTEGDGFGERVEGLGDFDGDGVPDIAVGAYGRDPAAKVKPEHRAVSIAPYTRIFSGKTGAVLLELPSRGEMAPVRDVDGDGRADLLYADRGARVTLRFGDASRPQLEIRPAGAIASGEFADSLCWTEDIDGDGRPDIAVSTVEIRPPRSDTGFTGLSSVTAYSSKDGHLLWEYLDTETRKGDASIVRQLADVDGDGVADLLVGLEDCYVATLSGRTGKKLLRHDAARHDIVYAFASSLDVIGDVDQDGVPDWVVGANEWPGAFFDFGTVEVISGKTSTRIRELEYSSDFGFDASGIGDVDADGVPDIAVAIQGRDSGLQPAVEVRSGKTGKVVWLKTLPELRSAAPR